MGNDLSVFRQFAVDLHSLAENSCRWGNAQPPCPLVQCVGNFVADDRHGTPTLSPGVAKPVVPATSLMVAILSSTRPFCHGEWAAVVCTGVPDTECFSPPCKKMPDRMLAEIVQSHSHQKNVLSTLWQLHHETLAVNQSDGQTEDGHAMMKLSTFHSFQTLNHAVRGCQKTVNEWAPI